MVRNHPYGCISQGCGHALAPLVIEKDHGQLLIESALHSYHILVEVNVLSLGRVLRRQISVPKIYGLSPLTFMIFLQWIQILCGVSFRQISQEWLVISPWGLQHWVCLKFNGHMTSSYRDICVKVTPKSIWIHCRSYMQQWEHTKSYIRDFTLRLKRLKRVLLLLEMGCESCLPLSIYITYRLNV